MTYFTAYKFTTSSSSTLVSIEFYTQDFFTDTEREVFSVDFMNTLARNAFIRAMESAARYEYRHDMELLVNTMEEFVIGEGYKYMGEAENAETMHRDDLMKYFRHSDKLQSLYISIVNEMTAKVYKLLSILK